MPERRSYERINSDGSVSFRRAGSSSPACRACEAHLENISFGGFAMYSAQAQDAEAVIDFELTAPSLDQPLVGKGKIRHVTLPQRCATPIFTMGVEFIEADKDLVTYLIKRLQLKISHAASVKQKSNPVDFIPY